MNHALKKMIDDLHWTIPKPNKPQRQTIQGLLRFFETVVILSPQGYEPDVRICYYDNAYRYMKLINKEGRITYF